MIFEDKNSNLSIYGKMFGKNRMKLILKYAGNLLKVCRKKLKLLLMSNLYPPNIEVI